MRFELEKSSFFSACLHSSYHPAIVRISSGTTLSLPTTYYTVLGESANRTFSMFDITRTTYMVLYDLSQGLQLKLEETENDYRLALVTSLDEPYCYYYNSHSGDYVVVGMATINHIPQNKKDGQQVYVYDHDTCSEKFKPLESSKVLINPKDIIGGKGTNFILESLKNSYDNRLKIQIGKRFLKQLQENEYISYRSVEVYDHTGNKFGILNSIVPCFYGTSSDFILLPFGESFGHSYFTIEKLDNIYIGCISDENSECKGFYGIRPELVEHNFGSSSSLYPYYYNSEDFGELLEVGVKLKEFIGLNEKIRALENKIKELDRKQVIGMPGPKGDKGDRGMDADPEEAADKLVTSKATEFKEMMLNLTDPSGKALVKELASSSDLLSGVAQKLINNRTIANSILEYRDPGGDLVLERQIVGRLVHDKNIHEGIANELIDDRAEELADALLSRTHQGNDTLVKKLANSTELTKNISEELRQNPGNIQGPKGDKGEIGVPGTPGKKGEIGLKGDQGPIGLEGNMGKKGDIGVPGTPGLKGEKGDVGLPGREGDKGAQGLKGEQGFNGAQGEKGNIGLKGDRGEIGLPGMDGPTGLPGPKGVAGAPGTSGLLGIPGPQGTPGIDGLKGEIGLPGPVGPKGNQGSQGEKGEPGIDGAVGPKGDKGEIGVPGADGLKGEAVPQGNIGEKGNTGVPGIPGPKGDKGDVGLPGTPGPKGEIGLPGMDGPMGLQGPKGVDGMPGLKGNMGDKGNTGVPAIPGSRGNVGPRGPQGNKGDQGLVGSKGFKGEQGPQGFNGTQGEKGDIGTPGPKGDKGKIGVPGINGLKGDTGPRGDKGDIGPKGVDGLPGLKGDTGPQGFNGKQGVQGEKGAQGLVGPKGNTGAPGLKGSKGKDGVGAAEADQFLREMNKTKIEIQSAKEAVEVAKTASEKSSKEAQDAKDNITQLYTKVVNLTKEAEAFKEEADNFADKAFQSKKNVEVLHSKVKDIFCKTKPTEQVCTARRKKREIKDLDNLPVTSGASRPNSFISQVINFFYPPVRQDEYKLKNKIQELNQTQKIINAVDIVIKFEKVLGETALHCGIAKKSLNFDPRTLESTIISKSLFNDENRNELLKLLCASAKKSCPNYQQIDKFLATFKVGMERTLTSNMQQRGFINSEKIVTNNEQPRSFVSDVIPPASLNAINQKVIGHLR